MVRGERFPVRRRPALYPIGRVEAQPPAHTVGAACRGNLRSVICGINPLSGSTSNRTPSSSLSTTGQKSLNFAPMRSQVAPSRSCYRVVRKKSACFLRKLAAKWLTAWRTANTLRRISVATHLHASAELGAGGGVERGRRTTMAGDDSPEVVQLRHGVGRIARPQFKIQAHVLVGWCVVFLVGDMPRCDGVFATQGHGVSSSGVFVRPVQRVCRPSVPASLFKLCVLAFSVVPF